MLVIKIYVIKHVLLNSMNYSKLKRLITDSKYSIASISHKIGRTEAWFHRAVKNDTMTICDLEKILAELKMTTAEFFSGEKSIMVVKEPQAQYGQPNPWQMLAEDRQREIDRLNKELAKHENKSVEIVKIK